LSALSPTEDGELAFECPLDQSLLRNSLLEAKLSERLLSLLEGDISAIIQMAWEDRTAFETIQERMGWSEADVIRLMRHELQPRSFRVDKGRGIST